MALSFGFRLNEEREGAWIADPAFMDVPSTSREDWRKDGAAAHLLPYAKNGTPTLFKFRALNEDEARYVRRFASAESGVLVDNVAFECFALGVRFPDQQEDTGKSANGVRVQTMVRDANGFARLSTPFLNALGKEYPGLIDFYGMMVFTATFPSEPEKKALSPQSTPKPSPADGATSQGTAAETAPAA